MSLTLPYQIGIITTNQTLSEWSSRENQNNDNLDISTQVLQGGGKSVIRFYHIDTKDITKGQN